jgi:hypothetical protein
VDRENGLDKLAELPLRRLVIVNVRVVEVENVLIFAFRGSEKIADIPFPRESIAVVACVKLTSAGNITFK